MKKKRPPNLKDLSVTELEALGKQLMRESDLAYSRVKDIDKELQARRTVVPANQPYPYTDEERYRLNLDNERHHL